MKGNYIMTIGEKITKLRTAADISQEQLAEIRKKRFVTADEIRALQTAEEKIRLEANKKFSEFRWRALKMEKGHYRW